MFTVNVSDNQAPVFTNCPGNVIVSSSSANPLSCTQTASWTAPTASDPCGIASITSDHNPGDLFSTGATIVTYTATDIHGNVSTCTFTVTVVDNTAPIFTSCPSPIINVPINSPGCQATVATVNPTYADNCGVVTLTWSLSGATTGTSPSTGINTLGTHAFNAGLTTVTYTAADAAGNLSTCIFTVSVVNNLAGNISGTATVLQNGSTTPNISFSGSGGTKPYTFTYNVSVNGNPAGANQTVTTTGANSVVTVPQSNAVLGDYLYTLVSVTDAFGCSGTLPADNTDTIMVVTALARPDLYTEVLYPPASFYNGLTRDGYVEISNASASPTTGTIVFRVSKLATFNFSLLGTTSAVTVGSGGPTAVQNNNWTITSNALYYTITSKPGTVINGNSSNKIGFTLTAISGANTNGIMTVTVINGTGGSNATNGDSLDANNQAVKLFLIN